VRDASEKVSDDASEKEGERTSEKVEQPMK
jgi:hypothetical protein